MEDKLPAPPQAKATSTSTSEDLPAGPPPNDVPTSQTPDVTQALEKTSSDSQVRGDGKENQDLEEPLPQIIPSKGALIAGNLLALIGILWVMWTPLMNGLHQNDSAFTGLLRPIPTWFYAICLAIPVLLWIACAVHGLTKGFSREARIFRLPPLAVVLALGCHLLFIRAFEPPHPPPNAIVREVLAHAFSTPLSTEDGLFPTAPKFYVDALSKAPPPFSKDGKRLTRWNAIVTENCTTPLSSAPLTVEPGTFLVCVSSARTEASLQAVVLSREVVGEAALLTWRHKPLTVPLTLEKKRGSMAASASKEPEKTSPSAPSATPASQGANATAAETDSPQNSANEPREKHQESQVTGDRAVEVEAP